MPELQKITDAVVRQVQQVTGVPVIITPDPALQLLAAMKMARGNAPAHLIHYNSRIAEADYAICYQCGLILRIAATPEGSRFDIGGTYQGRKDTEKLVNEHLRTLGSSLPKDMRLRFRDQLYDGLLRQLRSVPIGLRVDAWISQEHPALANQQKAMICRQLQDNTAVLKADIRRLAPEKVFSANVSMNAAFAAFWSRLWADPTLITPYSLGGHLEKGQGLLQVLDQVPDAPERDRQLIEMWGRLLGLERWFEFLPFQK